LGREDSRGGEKRPVQAIQLAGEKRVFGFLFLVSELSIAFDKVDECGHLLRRDFQEGNCMEVPIFSG
jgi:hypothetical protein